RPHHVQDRRRHAGIGPLHGRLGAAGRPLARGVGARDAELSDRDPAVGTRRPPRSRAVTSRGTMRRMRRPPPAAGALAVAGAACGTALNYLDPSGPLYEARYATAMPEGPGSRPLRVVTFNIEYALHVDRAIAVLQETPSLQGLDLLALQEMDAPAVARIASALCLTSLYIPSGVTPKTNRDIGCALLSPWPLVEPRKLLLPHGVRGTGLVRVAVGATLLRGERRLRVYAIHFP